MNLSSRNLIDNTILVVSLLSFVVAVYLPSSALPVSVFLHKYVANTSVRSTFVPELNSHMRVIKCIYQMCRVPLRSDILDLIPRVYCSLGYMH